jgi:antitoxin StbD
LTGLQSNHFASIIELREPHKVLDHSGGKPAAIRKYSKCVCYLVPDLATLQDEPRYATAEEVMESIERRRDINQPVLDYLKAK